MTNNKKAVAQLQSIDIGAKEENGTVYVYVGDKPLEIAQYEIDDLAKEWDKENPEPVRDKLEKEQLDIALDLGMTVALMSGEGRMDRLYDLIHEKLDIGGICDTAYTLSWIATEFMDIHRDTDWEVVVMAGKNDVLPDKFKNRSEKYKKYGTYVSCWDCAAEDYAEWRIETFNAEEFAKINQNRHAVNPMLKQ